VLITCREPSCDSNRGSGWRNSNTSALQEFVLVRTAGNRPSWPQSTTPCRVAVKVKSRKCHDHTSQLIRYAATAPTNISLRLVAQGACQKNTRDPQGANYYRWRRVQSERTQLDCNNLSVQFSSVQFVSFAVMYPVENGKKNHSKKSTVTYHPPKYH